MNPNKQTSLKFFSVFIYIKKKKKDYGRKSQIADATLKMRNFYMC